MQYFAFWQRKLLAFLLVPSILLLDQWSKHAVLAFFASKNIQSHPVAPSFNLVLTWNPGISFGMFQQIPYGHILLTTLGIGMSIALMWWFFTQFAWWSLIAIALVIAGAIGNIIDRVRYQAVVDFLDFYINTYHWPAFNVADSAICIGVAMLIYKEIRS